MKEKEKEGKTAAEKTKDGLPKIKDGLPWQAFAIVGDREEPETWKLPHHAKTINRALRGKIGLERTVDWEGMSAAVAALSRQGLQGQRVQAQPHEILAAARHLAIHYQKAGKPLPDTLAIFV